MCYAAAKIAEAEERAQIAEAQAVLGKMAEARLVLDKHAPDENGFCGGCREDSHEAHAARHTGH